MKIKKLIALAVAVLTITMAFAPAALAWTDASYNWANWPLQKNYPGYSDLRYTGAIQQYMNIKIPGSNLAVDGQFGDLTEGVVRTFQLNNGVGVDGKVGSETWSKMYSFLVHQNDYNGSGGNISSLMPGDSINVVYPTPGYYHIKVSNTYTSPGQYFYYASYKWYFWTPEGNTFEQGWHKIGR